MDNLTIVREACIKVVPGIMELKPGCEILNKHLRRILITDYLNKDKNCLNGHYKGENNGTWIWENQLKDTDTFEILGRPIRLADVLLTILRDNPANRTNVILESSGQFITKLHNGSFSENEAGPYWDLTDDDLNHASPECLQFLAGLLDNT